MLCNLSLSSCTMQKSKVSVLNEMWEGRGQFQVAAGTVSGAMQASKPTGSSGSQVSLVNTLPLSHIPSVSV